ncbi:MAG: lipopolysaccharide kinase InaA family protein [Candidatus Nanosalina sp.]
MNLGGETIRWNPHIGDEEKEDIAHAEFEEVPGDLINDDNSSEAFRWDRENYFAKEKERDPSKTIQELTRTGEFDHRLSLYDEHHDTGVHAPTPYCAMINPENDQYGDQVIMEFIGGENWTSFPRAFAEGAIVGEDEVKQVAEGLGRYSKILENECMGHGDVAWRHFFVNTENYDLAVIDIEGGTANARPSMIEEERQEISEVLDQIPRPQYEDQIYEWFAEGRESVPEPDETNLPTSAYDCNGNYGVPEGADEMLF